MYIKILGAAEFRNIKTQWHRLLNQSSADSLFLSWEWMYHWWTIFGNKPDDKLFILAAFDSTNDLVGIAPLYIQTRYLFTKKVTSQQLRFIGASNFGPTNFHIEHMQFITKRDQEYNTTTLLLDFIFQHRGFDECIFHNLIQQSQTYDLIKKNARIYGCLPRTQNTTSSYEINCKETFTNYLATLGKHTRLKAFNRRKLLQKHGEVQVLQITSHNIREILTPFVSFHKKRWGYSYNFDRQQAFLQALAKEGKITTGGLLLMVNGEAAACTLDIIYGNKAYNIQTGFSEGYDKKISLGTLMLGYAIEHYCLHPHIENYDLLAGRGKNTDYKTHFATVGEQFESLQLIRARYLKFMYYSKDILFAVKNKLTRPRKA